MTRCNQCGSHVHARCVGGCDNTFTLTLTPEEARALLALIEVCEVPEDENPEAIESLRRKLARDRKEDP